MSLERRLLCGMIFAVSYTEFFWTHQYIYLICASVKVKGYHHSWELYQFFFYNLKYLDWLKMQFPGWSKVFLQTLSSQIFGRPYRFNVSKIRQGTTLIWTAFTVLLYLKSLGVSYFFLTLCPIDVVLLIHILG